MDLTVAICTWNRSSLLNQTLAGMRNLHIPDGMSWELLVVNNSCTDDTDIVVEKYVDNLPICRLLETKPGLSNARNCALERARGDLLVWTDDDVLVDTEWAATLVDCARRHPEVTAFGGVIAPWFPVDPDPDLVAAFAPLRIGFCGVDHGQSERLLAPNEHIVGANMAFRMAAVADLRFNPQLGRIANQLGGWDDFEYVAQVRSRGGKVMWVPSARVRHYVDPSRMSLAYMKRYYEGLGDSQIETDGIPPGRQVFGIPGWLLRRCVATYFSSCVAHLRGDRRQYLDYTRQYHYRKGMALGCRSRITPRHVTPEGHHPA